MQNDKGFILVLHGPPDAGQSWVAGALLQGKANRFHVSTNKIKFLISDYSAETTDREALNRIIFAAGEAARREGLSLVVDGSLAIQRSWWSSYAVLAEETGAKFVQVNLEADREILLDRFKRRVANSRAKGVKISISEETDFQKRYDEYLSLKDGGLPTFDSHRETTDKIAEHIGQLIA